MKQEQQKQAENLYFQTDLSMTEITNVVGISRRTLHYWVREYQWDTIRQNAKAMPIALAGNCYLILSRLQDSILSPDRANKPITMQEVNAMHKLTVTIGKLRDRATLSENIEMMNHFVQFLNDTHSPVAESVKPIISEFLRHRAIEQSVKRAPFPAAAISKEVQDEEDRLDQEDLAALAEEAAQAAQADVPALSANAGVKQGATPVSALPGSANATPKTIATTLNTLTRPAGPAHFTAGHLGNRAARRAAARAAA